MEVKKITTATQFTFALAGLVTALTSLYKVYDKSLEQASYEALSDSIRELQEDQLALRSELASLRRTPDASLSSQCDCAALGDSGVSDYGVSDSVVSCPISHLQDLTQVGDASAIKNVLRHSIKQSPVTRPPTWRQIKDRSKSL